MIVEVVNVEQDDVGMTVVTGIDTDIDTDIGHGDLLL